MKDNISHKQKVFFTWYINTECNYKCSYCKPEKFTTRLAPTDTWAKIWQDIYEKYGRCHISFSGGEPFIYPGFIDILSHVTKNHTIEITTNLSFDVKPLIGKVDLKRIRMGCSLHPETADFEEFLAKLIALKKHDFEKWATFVAYPPSLQKMAYFKERIEKEGIRFSILPFNGKFNGKEYPQGYSEEERKLILDICADDEVNRKTFEFKNNPKKESASKQGACRMGQSYARIYPDGNVFRCCAKGALSLGNIIDGTFKLLEEPLECKIENCPCWKRMIAGEEDNWKKYWMVPWGTENL